MDHPAENSTDRCGALKPNAKLTDMPCEVDIYTIYTLSMKYLYYCYCQDSEYAYAYVCERALGLPPLCQEGWEHHGGSCYKVTPGRH